MMSHPADWEAAASQRLRERFRPASFLEAPRAWLGIWLLRLGPRKNASVQMWPVRPTRSRAAQKPEPRSSDSKGLT